MVVEVVKTCQGKRPHFIVNRLEIGEAPYYYGKSTGLTDGSFVDLELQTADTGEPISILSEPGHDHTNEYRYTVGTTQVGSVHRRKAKYRELLFGNRRFRLPISLSSPYMRVFYCGIRGKEYTVCFKKGSSYTFIEDEKDGSVLYAVHHEIKNNQLTRFVCFIKEGADPHPAILCALRLYVEYSRYAELMPPPYQMRERPTMFAELRDKHAACCSAVCASQKGAVCE